MEHGEAGSIGGAVEHVDEFDAVVHLLEVVEAVSIRIHQSHRCGGVAAAALAAESTCCVQPSLDGFMEMPGSACGQGEGVRADFRASSLSSARGAAPRFQPAKPERRWLASCLATRGARKASLGRLRVSREAGTVLAVSDQNELAVRH